MLWLPRLMQSCSCKHCASWLKLSSPSLSFPPAQQAMLCAYLTMHTSGLNMYGVSDVIDEAHAGLEWSFIVIVVFACHLVVESFNCVTVSNVGYCTDKNPHQATKAVLFPTSQSHVSKSDSLFIFTSALPPAVICRNLLYCTPVSISSTSTRYLFCNKIFLLHPSSILLV